MKNALIISCFNWYEARLKPIRDILVSKGYKVEVLIADFNHINKERISVLNNECTYIQVPTYTKNISIKRIFSHLSFGKSVKKYLYMYNPKLIICQIPPNIVAKYCLQYKKSRPKTKFIIDIIDLWPESMPLGIFKKSPLTYLWKRWRDCAITVADHVFTECNLYQKKLKNVWGKTSYSTLYLFKDQKENEKELVWNIIRKRKVDDTIRFAYVGSMNNIIDIDRICKEIKWFIENKKKCELHAIGVGENKEIFENAVKKTGCKTYFYGAIYDELEKISILAPCDFALNIMKSNISVGLTIKSIDYLSYGLPLLNNIKGDTWQLVEEEGVGVNVGKCCPVTLTIDHMNIWKVYQKYFTRESFVESFMKVLK